MTEHDTKGGNAVVSPATPFPHGMADPVLLGPRTKSQAVQDYFPSMLCF